MSGAARDRKIGTALEGKHYVCVLGMPRPREHNFIVTYRGAKRGHPASSSGFALWMTNISYLKNEMR